MRIETAVKIGFITLWICVAAGGCGKKSAQLALSASEKSLETAIPAEEPAEQEPVIRVICNCNCQSQSGENQENNSQAQPVDDGRVNINTADAAALQTLNGIGASRAQAIISYRETHGAFQTTEDIKNVEGIKDGIYNKIKDCISVG